MFLLVEFVYMDDFFVWLLYVTSVYLSVNMTLYVLSSWFPQSTPILFPLGYKSVPFVVADDQPEMQTSIQGCKRFCIRGETKNLQWSVVYIPAAQARTGF